MSTTVIVDLIPQCDFHPDVIAHADARTRSGRWAHVCARCFKQQGCTLGTGCGQKYIQSRPPVDLPVPFNAWMRSVNVYLGNETGMDASELPDVFDFHAAWCMGATPRGAASSALQEMGADL